jgi:photosystem II stability/assembly factor-like uncharacterized protein
MDVSLMRRKYGRWWFPLCLIAVATAVLAASTASSSAKLDYLWRPVAIGGGGSITSYSTGGAGITRVAGTDVYGAYLWCPELDRWTQLITARSMPEADRVQAGMNQGVYAIAVAPSDPNRLYMAIKGRVYRSSDRGARWRRPTGVNPFPVAFDPNSEFRFYGPFLAVSPRDPNLVLLGTPAGGVWRSRDGGSSWGRVNSIPANSVLRHGAVQQSPGSLIWFEKGRSRDRTGRIWVFVAGAGMFVSDDRGDSFSQLPSPLSGPRPFLIKRGEFAPDGIFYGVDGEGKKVWKYSAGAWTEIEVRPGLSPHVWAAVAVNPRGGEILLFDQGGAAFRSNDGGARWSPLAHRVGVGQGDPPWLHVNDQSYFATGDVAFDPAIADRLWVSAGSGMYYADLEPEARTIRWTSEVRGIEELVANDAIAPPGGPALFAAWDFGIHAKGDLSRFSTTYGPRERVLISAQQLDWSPSDPRFIVTNASDARMCCAEDGDAVMAGYSLDGGRTWSKFATLPQPPGTAAGDPWRMSFGTIAVSSGDTANIVWEPAFDRSPFYTTDRGRHWKRVIFPGEHLPQTGSYPNYWMQRKTLAADRVRSGVFYLVHSGSGQNRALAGLWRTEDGGATWERMFKGEIAPNSGLAAKLRAVPGRAGQLFFTSGLVGGADARLWWSVDGGTSWDAVPGITNVDDIAFGKAAPGESYPAIYISGRVFGRYGIWRSTDQGAQWRKLAAFPLGRLDQVTVVEADKDKFGRVYIGFEGSGWIYGEPGHCAAAEMPAAKSSECIEVGAATAPKP